MIRLPGLSERAPERDAPSDWLCLSVEIPRTERVVASCEGGACVRVCVEG